MVAMPVIQGTIMTTNSDLLAGIRLFQLISPSLPTGAFTYSQGLEWAVECGWVKNRDDLIEWLNSLLFSSFQEMEIPLLRRLYRASVSHDLESFSYWSDYVVACRETRELRLEESNRGRAMAKILEQLFPELESDWLEIVQKCQVAGFALAAARWGIELQHAALGYVWGWLENMVMAAVKNVPLGQTAGQQALVVLSESATHMVEVGLNVKDDNIGGSCPAFAIASCLHETQYTRLFRS